MKKFLSSRKRLLTILIALAGIAVVWFYNYCSNGCSSLQGTLLGFDLKYLGIFYMAVVLLLAWFRRPLLCLLLLSFGVGAEIFLVGFQVYSDVYCRYCLAFGATVLLAFAVNFEQNRKTLAVLTAAVGLLFFLIFFSGSVTPAYAAGALPPDFGKGPIEVRVYTDYFCGPCQAEEAELIALVKELVGKDLIHVLFIDTPIHGAKTVIYARYFLAALNAKHDFQQAVDAREALFAAAKQELAGQEALEAFLKKKGVAFRPYDTTPVFKIFSNYLKEDKIRSTPSCVILSPQGKQTLTGRDDIIKGLRALRKQEKEAGK